MKGGGGVSSYGPPTKRRWRGLVIAVLGLVILSMLVPLVFLLGLHNGFHSSGYVSDRRSSDSNSLRRFDNYNRRDGWNHSEGFQPSHVDDLIRKLAPTLPKDVLRNFSHEAKKETFSSGTVHNSQVRKGLPVPLGDALPSHSNTNNTRVDGTVHVTEHTTAVMEGSGKSCELKFGSYCLWRQEHREEMKDSMIKKLKDRLFVARAYYPSIAKLPSQNKLSRELRQNIQELERVLSETTTDVDLPPQIGQKLQKMESAIARAKSFTVDCNNVDKKLRQIFDMTEDEANFHMKQSAFLHQLAVQTMPKSLHCLSMQLTVEYFRSPSHKLKLSQSEIYVDPTLHHYVIFSNNVLASSVVINSTVMHAKESRSQVFHVLTNEQNYFAMKLWYFRNRYKESTVQVLNIEHLKLDNHDKATLLHLSLPQEFRVSFRSLTHSKTEYISTFSQSHYLLPEVFNNLKKVVVLDDDIVVQQDLSALWNLNLGGKVNGAMQFCQVRLVQLKGYLGENSFNEKSCAWMSGLNVIDLVRWRELHLSESFRSLVKKMSMQERSIEAVVLRASLLTFQDQVYAIDDDWVVSGLGHDYGLDVQALKKAAVLHYNGNMKPWLEMGIPKYKEYWKKFLTREDVFLSKCNVNS